MSQENKAPARPELPPPITTPLGREREVLARLPASLRPAAEEALGDADVFVLVATRTRTDVGMWLRRARVWAAALSGELVLFAAPGPVSHRIAKLLSRGPFASLLAPGEPHAERTPFPELNESVYNHVTGELVLAPAKHTRVKRLRMSPLDGYQMLAQIRREEPTDA